MTVLSDEIVRFLRATGPEPTKLQREMAEFADDEGFPIVGPDVGGLLGLLAQLGNASTVFEFGSGFGYSALWIARALTTDGRIVLTEIDETELDMAREYFDRAGLADRAAFEHGDALEVVREYDGPFDIVLFDHEKRRYLEAVDLIRGKLEPGGTIIADNMMYGPAAFDDILAGLEGTPQTDDTTRGIVSYLEEMRDDPAFNTTVLPVGNGIAVSVKR